MSMKMKLFLFVTATLLAGISGAHAQTCMTASLNFPTPPTPPGPLIQISEPRFCLQSPGATGRLRWDNNGSGELQLFDTDDGGTLLWCAHLNNGNGPCAVGKSFCLQSDGNAVIYAGDNCTGDVQWASNTVGKNINGEVLEVGDNFCGEVGEKAVILNNVNTSPSCPIWSSTSFDPS